MESFIHLITSFGVFAILLVVFAESGLLIGFVLPGDSLLFTAGYMVQQNILHIDIHIFALLVFAAAVLGDRPIVRTFAPIVAGASKMHYKTFLTFNLIGGFIWSSAFVYLGFYAGEFLTKAGVNIEVAAILIIFLSVSPMVIHALKQPNTRALLRRQLSVLLSKTKRKK